MGGSVLCQSLPSISVHNTSKNGDVCYSIQRGVPPGRKHNETIIVSLAIDCRHMESFKRVQICMLQDISCLSFVVVAEQ